VFFDDHKQIFSVCIYMYSCSAFIGRVFVIQHTCLLCVAAGKVWKPKEEEKVQINEDEKVETEWDEVLAQATEEELVDLAGMLQFC